MGCALQPEEPMYPNSIYFGPKCSPYTGTFVYTLSVRVSGSRAARFFQEFSAPRAFGSSILARGLLLYRPLQALKPQSSEP